MKKLITIALTIIVIGACKKSTPTTATTAPPVTNNNTTINNNAKWVKPEYYITYDIDGITEKQKTEFSYDAEGRVMSYTAYYNGQVSIKQRDYIYNGNECTYYVDMYTNGVVTSTNKMKAGYFNQ